MLQIRELVKLEKEREKKLGKLLTLLQEVPINTVFQSAAFKYATDDDRYDDKQCLMPCCVDTAKFFAQYG